MSFPFPYFGLQTRRMVLLGLGLAALTGCQSLSSTGSSAKVRVIDVSPDDRAVDVYQGNTAVAYNLNFGTVTSYLPINAGASTITIDPAGSRQVMASIEGSFAPDAHYTILVGSSVTNAEPLILTDHSPLVTAKTQGTPLVRFIHQAMRTGPVDVYLVPAGQRLASATPIATNLAAGANTGYLAVPVCTCTAVMLPAGTLPSATATAVHNGAQSSYLSGSARTIVLLDAPASSNVQVVVATDAEPST